MKMQRGKTLAPSKIKARGKRCVEACKKKSVTGLASNCARRDPTSGPPLRKGQSTLEIMKNSLCRYSPLAALAADGRVGKAHIPSLMHSFTAG